MFEAIIQFGEGAAIPEYGSFTDDLALSRRKQGFESPRERQ
jgi:hypothetical protein